MYGWGLMILSDEQRYRQNMEAIALAEFELGKEAQRQSLKLQHRTMIVALAAVGVALLSSLLALAIALAQKPPVVNVQAPASQTHRR